MITDEEVEIEVIRRDLEVRPNILRYPELTYADALKEAFAIANRKWKEGSL